MTLALVPASVRKAYAINLPDTVSMCDRVMKREMVPYVVWWHFPFNSMMGEMHHTSYGTTPPFNFMKGEMAPYVV